MSLWLLAHTQTASAAEVGPGVVIAYERYQLPNGLTVVLSHDARVPRVAVSVWYYVGLRHESITQPGVMRLIEQAMFRGSAHVGDGEHLARLERAGATQVGAEVALDHSRYYETVSSNYLEMALWLESDRMLSLQSALSASTLEPLLAARDGGPPLELTRARVSAAIASAGIGLPAAFAPYLSLKLSEPGEARGANAKPSTLAAVQSVLAQYYVPANASLVLVGDFDPVRVKRSIAKYFGALPRSTSPAPQMLAPALDTAAQSSVETLSTLGPALISWRVPSSGAFTPDDAAAHVLAKVLSAGRSSRLYQALVAERTLAQSVLAQQHSAGARSFFVVQAVARPSVSSSQLRAALGDALAGVCANPFRADEVERAKLAVETELLRGTQTLAGLAQRLQYYVQYAGEPGDLQRDLAQYRRLSPESVHSVAKRLLCAVRGPL